MLSLAAAVASAQPVRPEMIVAERGDQMVVSTTVGSVFDASAYERLGNGLASTVVIRMWVYRQGQPQPIAFRLLHRQVVYDLWDEVYEVALTSSAGRRTHRARNRAEALKLMTTLDQVEIAARAELAPDIPYVLTIVAELNPVSQETLAEVRRWLSEGSGGGLDRGGSFFGSFVSVFVNLKLADSDRVVRLSSPPFRRGGPRRP